MIICLAVAGLVPPGPAASSRYYGFAVGVANAPPPPVLRLARDPHVVLASDAMVYVVDDPSVRFDGDLFRYGQYWFAYTHGYWYRARAHSGNYSVMDVRKIPRAIIGVPRRMWKHHPLSGAPGHVTTTAGAASRIQPTRAYGPPAPATARADADAPRSRMASSR